MCEWTPRAFPNANGRETDLLSLRVLNQAASKAAANPSGHAVSERKLDVHTCVVRIYPPPLSKPSVSL